MATPQTPGPIARSSAPGRRRAARIAAATGLVAALVASGTVPAFASDDPGTTPPVKASDSADKLGAVDAQRLTEAQANGEKNVTVLVATAPGATEQVAAQLDAVAGASVGKQQDALGYVRATLPTAKAEAAIRAATKLSSVQAVDLQAEIPLDDPRPEAGAVEGTTVAKTYPAPGKKTPARNPYNPSHETGAVDFVESHPKADGRGVTIGVLDSGVDLGHPALQKTTTGERKIVDWVTATDPLTEGDATWRAQITPVAGPVFTASTQSWKAPEGAYRFSLFTESITAGGDPAGDINRDGDTTDVFGLLYDPAAGTVRVDTDQNNDFTDNAPMKPYKDGFQIGYFGTDDPATEVVEKTPFVVEIRKDVPMDPAGGTWVGKKADFVNVGLVGSSHGTHVAGITAAHGLFGGRMNGAAPGAKIVSSRACTWTGGCTNTALTEGMTDLVVNRGVDIVNMSIGGLPQQNDGDNVRARLYTRLIDQYGVQLVISAGNSGPGINTIGDPGLADKVLSVGAAVSKDTWAANYGSAVEKKYAMFPFSSRGPREDGGFTPTITAPGSAVNTIPTWLPGAGLAESGYALPAGYGMLNGTSMSSPQAAGASALLLSAAKQKGIALSPLTLRTALTSTARRIPGVAAHEQGAGRIDIEEAWESIKDGATAHDYKVQAPVDTLIFPAPRTGTGVYDREGDLKVGQKRVYDVTLTRTSGPDRPVRHDLDLKYNDGTFRIVGEDRIYLPLNQPVTVKLQAKASSAGVHSVILEADDERTEGVDKQILATSVVAHDLAAPAYGLTAQGSVQRNSTTSYFVTVPQGAKTLEVSLSGLKEKSQTRFIAIHPVGVPVDPTATTGCYPHYNPANTCRPDLRSYPNPTPGVWEVEVEARRTSPDLDNPYTLGVSALGVDFDPVVQTVPEAKVGTPAPVQWKVANRFAGIEGTLKGGSLGSQKTETPTILNKQKHTRTVTIGEGVERLDIAIGNTSDRAADLDLTVSLNGKQVAQAADGDSEEAVSLVKPAAGTYTVVIDGYSVQAAGGTTYDYKDVYYSSALGTVKVDGSKPAALPNGGSATVTAEVVVAGAAPEGRQFFGEVQLVNARGTVAGAGSVLIGAVTP
ncbi:MULTISPECIES: S8 family serine peptidase [unclassified Streptomyces]|uniref:S8 family serine peptidase n=1 Tax=unclassified Streptomyces TaxID=2593676 RepID=UPI0006C17AED|nr:MULTISPECIES: S8 family serine peptidase [unclassified Streptomyces]KOX27908.1 serine protease [Streptomyces sp. NRRL F-6491]KOX38255.1 serine protease [Streptomyces sp. NRRL F-6492]